MRAAKAIPALVFALICFAAASASAETTTTHVRDKGTFAIFEDTQGGLRTVVMVAATTIRADESGPGALSRLP
jgi:hypothetical protein